MSDNLSTFVDAYKEARKGPRNARLSVVVIVWDDDGRILLIKDAERCYSLPGMVVAGGAPAWEDAENLGRYLLGTQYSEVTLFHIYYDQIQDRHILAFTHQTVIQPAIIRRNCRWVPREEFGELSMIGEHHRMLNQCIFGEKRLCVILPVE